MYTIAQVIYGIPLDIDFDYYYSEVEEEAEDSDQEYVRLLENHFENDTEGFLRYYSGSSENSPRAFGIEIDEFDECKTVKVSELNLVASEEVKKKYQELFNALDEDTQEELKAFGEPEVFFLWSTS